MRKSKVQQANELKALPVGIGNQLRFILNEPLNQAITWEDLMLPVSIDAS